MAVRAAHLLTLVEAKTDEHDRKLRQAGKEVENLAKKDKELSAASKDAARSLSDMGKAAALAFSAATLAAAKRMFDAASNLNETVSKSRQVFRESSRDIERWAQNSARAMGQSRQQAIEAAATYGNLLTSMNVTREAAGKMSTQMVQLASDLASFNNVPVAQALEAIRSGLVGETEPLRQFGVNLNEATLKAEALRLKLISSTKEGLEPSTKAAAAFSLMMKQTANAQGDFARTAGGAANQGRILRAQFDDLAASLGQNLLPHGNKALQWLNGMLESFNKADKATQQFGLALVGVAAAGGPIAQLITKLGQLRLAMVGAGLLTPITAAAAGIALAVGTTSKWVAGRMNAANDARAKSLESPGYVDFQRQADEARRQAGVLDADIAQVRANQHQRITSLRNQGFIPAYKIAEENRFFERQIQEIRRRRDVLNEEAARNQKSADFWKARYKPPRPDSPAGEAPAPFAGVDWMGGIPTQTPGVDEGKLKRARDAWQRHLEAMAAMRKEAADRIAAAEQNEYQQRLRDLNQFLERMRKAGLSRAERGAVYGAVRSDIVRDAVSPFSAALSSLSSVTSDGFSQVWKERARTMEVARTAAQGLSGALSGLGSLMNGTSAAVHQASAQGIGQRMFGGMSAQSFVGDFSGSYAPRPASASEMAGRQFNREARSAGRELLLGIVGRRGENRDLFRRFATELRDGFVGAIYDNSKNLLKPITDNFRDGMRDAIKGVGESVMRTLRLTEASVGRMLGMVFAAIRATQRKFNPFAAALGVGVGLLTGSVGLGLTAYNASASLMEGNVGAALYDIGAGAAAGQFSGLGGSGGGGGGGAVDGSHQYPGYSGGRAVYVSLDHSGPTYVNERADVERVARETVRRSVAAVRSGSLG